MSDVLKVQPRLERLPLPRDCTFTPEDWSVLSRAWYPVARTDELADKPIQAQLLDTDLVVYRAADRTSIAYRKLLKGMGLGAPFIS